MTADDNWLEDFDRTHQDLASPAVYWLSVPVIVLGVVGTLWSLPVPEQFYRISPLLNWGSALLMATTVYYFIISLPIAIGLLPFLLAIAACQLWLQRSGLPVAAISLALLAAGIAGLWLGHRGERPLRALLDDVLLSMMAPAWMLSRLYRRLGIPY